ncbi:hypothetical protein [Aquipseudomonas alcaligenes]|uniref:hypothetical protein n=1 Tax=Aquipseudomonas alcaligenes TaxID=43263 RepID=UPI0037495304
MRTLILSALLLTLAGCAGSSRDEHVQMRLQASPRNAGQIAQATLVPREAQTDVTAFVSGVPMGMTLPVRLYAFIYAGHCGQLDAKPAYELNNTVRTSHKGPLDGWHLSRSAKVPLSTLQATPHALVLRAPSSDGGQDLFCGDIP